MANLTGILGTMLATGMAGRSRRGPSFAAKAGGGSFKQTAGLAALGYLAYKAYTDHQRRGAGEAAGGGGGGKSLFGRLTEALQSEPQAEGQAEMGDQKALLLIRAMVAAAAADGEIGADERQRILSRLDEAGASDEDNRVLEAELAAPQPIDSLLKNVGDEETAEQVYVASQMAIEPDSTAERSYLQYLAARLNLDPARMQPGGPA